MSSQEKLEEARGRILSEYVNVATSGWCGCHCDCSCADKDRAKEEAYETCLDILGVSSDERKKAIADYKATYPQLFGIRYFG